MSSPTRIHLSVDRKPLVDLMDVVTEFEGGGIRFVHDNTEVGVKQNFTRTYYRHLQGGGGGGLDYVVRSVSIIANTHKETHKYIPMHINALRFIST